MNVKYKIYGIGLSRTGTRSLVKALDLLGYTLSHNPPLNSLFKHPQDGGADISVTRYYKELDKKFPKSKFIHTIREKEQWLNSMEAHFERKPSSRSSKKDLENRIAVYGQADFDRKIFSAKYDQHYTDVETHFKDRPKNLLILNICAGEGWEKLMPFLGHKEPPQKKFPHDMANKR